MVLVVEGRLLLNSDLVTLSVICDNFTTQEKKLAFTFMQWTTSILSAAIILYLTRESLLYWRHHHKVT
jgi:hypothetical protein